MMRRYRGKWRALVTCLKVRSEKVAGEARIREVVTAAGFTRFRRVAETPFNAVYEARP